MSTLSFLLFLTCSTQAQNLTGIWRGYFSSASAVYGEGVRETYKYEIQLSQQANNSLKGVTYSYKTTIFYGKAEISGIYTPTAKNLILKETRLVDLKIADKSEPCLMTCYLDYVRIGKLEALEGNFISINAKDKSDCGSGKVYLERVNTSDFKKEDFLTKKKTGDTVKLLSKINSPATDSRKSLLPPVSPNAKTGSDNLRKSPPVVSSRPAAGKIPQSNNVPAPGTKAQVTETGGKRKSTAKTDKGQPNTTQPPEPTAVVVPKKEESTVRSPQTDLKKIPTPRVLLERENNLVRTINTPEENILIELYDNGTIDNDTISVYHNNELVISEGRLSYSPLSVKIRCSKTDSRHEITVVANNLGEIPPNTALMVIKAGKERYEIFLASNETRNAKVVINYVPKTTN